MDIPRTYRLALKPDARAMRSGWTTRVAAPPRFYRKTGGRPAGSDG
ncbi:hypothetical protein OH687_36995 [Burkholderia anthina]|nr:hypothetical protein OH687_36995 [Burkholderia anthina]